MIKANIKQLWLLAILAALSDCSINAYTDLVTLSPTLHSLTNRANELGLLIQTPSFKTNPDLSDSLNQILSALETKKLDKVQQDQAKVSQTINSLLRLLITKPYEIKDGIISFEYEGFKFQGSLDQFANELLLIANLAASLAVNNKTPINIVSNVFRSPVLYLFLNTVLAEEDRTVNLSIIGDISKLNTLKIQKNLKTKLSKTKGKATITFYKNTIEFAARKTKDPIDIYLLNPEIKIDHIKNNVSLCEKTTADKVAQIKIFPRDFNETFLSYSFLAVDQRISKPELIKFARTLRERTKEGAHSLKTESVEGFTCIGTQDGPKTIADLITAQSNQPKVQLFLSSNNKVASVDLTSSDIANEINLLGLITRVTSNLDTGNVINGELKNNITFYKYNATNKLFKKYKDINSIAINAINLSDNI